MKYLRPVLLGTAAMLVMISGIGCSDDDDDNDNPTGPEDATRSFTMTVRNLSDSGLLRGGLAVETPFAPGVWVLSDQMNVLYTSEQPDRGEGLEGLAEDGTPDMLSASLDGRNEILAHGSLGPIGPGDEVTLTFDAQPGSYLTFATMYVQSNDIILTTGGQGIALFEGDDPVVGNLTSQVLLVDAGTEINEMPGTGMYQAPRQSGPDMGPTEGVVQVVADGWSYPTNDEVLSVMVSSMPSGSGATFTVQIDNVSSMANPYPLAPGVWATFDADNPLFDSGTADFGAGLEGLAEDGSNGSLMASLQSMSGVTASGGFGSAPAGPGDSYMFTFDAAPGDKLTFATMFVQSNDLFYSPAEEGLELFDGGMPIGADTALEITDLLSLWDAGTEINEEPGVGMYQAPRQPGPDMGPREGIVQPVQDGYDYGSVEELIEVSIVVN